MKNVGASFVGQLLLIPFLLFLFPVFSYSQQVETAEVDTPVIEPLDLKTVEMELALLREKYRKDYKPLISMDNHYTAFFGQTANFWGLKLGLEFMENYRMGFGAYYMPKKVAMAPRITDTDTTYQKFRMHYYTTFFEWIFIHNFKWELALPVSAGYGRAEVEQWVPGSIRETQGKWVPGKDVGEFVATVSVNAHYKIFSWAGVGVGLGWRQILSPNQQIQKDFSGIVLSYKVKIFLSYIYKGLFKKEQILEEKGDYRWRKYMQKNYKRLKREQKK